VKNEHATTQKTSSTCSAITSPMTVYRGPHMADVIFFFKVTLYKESSVTSCLQYILENAVTNFEDRESILENVKRKVQSISDKQYTLSHARNKASSICSTFAKATERKEVKDLLERIEMKATHDLNEIAC
ncbi:9173_t:CDS:2, partial [Funneliformis mosseae]